MEKKKWRMERGSRRWTEGGAEHSGDGSGTAGANGSATPGTRLPSLISPFLHPAPPTPGSGHLSVSAPSSVLSGGARGSRLAGPCGGGSPSSGAASRPAGRRGESKAGCRALAANPYSGGLYLLPRNGAGRLKPPSAWLTPAATLHFSGGRTDGKASENMATDSCGQGSEEATEPGQTGGSA